MDKLLAQFNKQLSRHHISVKEGVLVDASLVDTPHKPNGNITIEVADDREDDRSQEEKEAEEDYQNRLSVSVKGRMKKPVGFTNKSVITTDTKSIV